MNMPTSSTSIVTPRSAARTVLSCACAVVRQAISTSRYLKRVAGSPAAHGVVLDVLVQVMADLVAA